MNQAKMFEIYPQKNSIQNSHQESIPSHLESKPRENVRVDSWQPENCPDMTWKPYPLLSHFIFEKIVWIFPANIKRRKMPFLITNEFSSFCRFFSSQYSKLKTSETLKLCEGQIKYAFELMMLKKSGNEDYAPNDIQADNCFIDKNTDKKYRVER